MCSATWPQATGLVAGMILLFVGAWGFMDWRIDRVDHVVLNVRDVERAAAWYERVLGMERIDFDPGRDQPRRTALKFGRQKINLRPVDASVESWFTAASPVAGSDDLCFIATAGPAEVERHLRACGVAIEAGPVVKQGAMGPIVSVYCRDPDGNLIEIAVYRQAGE